MNYLKMEFPDRFHHIGLLILRVSLGLCMIYGHGWGKFTRLFGTDEIKFADPFGLGPVASLAMAAFAEVICSILVITGFYTRLATIPLMITMITAFFVSHLDDPFGQQEKVILFGFAFLALFFTGPGKYSLDSKIQEL